MKKYSGNCLCEHVSFEVEAEFTKFFFCHCSRCRKSSGTAHGANLFSENGNLKWISGEENVRTFRVPDTRFAKSFCEICGSALPRVGSGGGIVVPAGSLNSDVDTIPSAHIFVESKANWDEALEKVARIEGSPK